MRLHQGYPRLPVPAILRVLRRCAARRCALVSFAALRAALILRAPLLIRLRFAADPSGWRPRYHPLRFARIIRYAPRRAARDARTASITPVPADSLRLRIRHDIVSIHAFRGEGDPTPRSPYRARAGPLARVVARAPTSIPDREFQSTPSGGKATPHREARTARAGPLARIVARAPQDVHAHRHDPRRRFAPFQSTPSGGKATPHREARTARAGPPARVVARAPTGVPARTDVTRRRRPERARSRPERARSQPEARTAPEAGQKPARSPYRARSRAEARTAPDAARNAPGASHKLYRFATSPLDDHRPGLNLTATPRHYATATARAPVAPDGAGAQRRSSVAVAPPGYIVCTQVLCESAPPFSFTLTRADTDAAHPAFTLLPQAGPGTGQVQRANSTTRHRIWRP